MGAASAFDAFEVPPLADATRDFVIPVLFRSVSNNN